MQATQSSQRTKDTRQLPLGPYAKAEEARSIRDSEAQEAGGFKGQPGGQKCMVERILSSVHESRRHAVSEA